MQGGFGLGLGTGVNLNLNTNLQAHGDSNLAPGCEMMQGAQGTVQASHCAMYQGANHVAMGVNNEIHGNGYVHQGANQLYSGAQTVGSVGMGLGSGLAGGMGAGVSGNVGGGFGFQG